MRIGRRVVRVLLFAIVLCLSTLGGGLWFAYWYITDSETAAKVIREHAARYFPHATLRPGRVRIRPLLGEVVLHQLQLIQRIDGVSFATLQIPYLNVRINPHKLLDGHLQAREIMVSQPTLRLRQRQDGSWNLQDLLADPWPGPWLDTPPILIRKATLELFPYEPLAMNGPIVGSMPATPSVSKPSVLPSANVIGPGVNNASAAVPKATSAPSPVVLRDVELKIESNGGPGLIRFEGSARGDAFERLVLNGTIDFYTGSINLNGELSGLTLTETLRRRIPRELQPSFQALAINTGVVNAELSQFHYNPTAAPGSRVQYQAQVRLREAVWESSKLPFFVTDFSAHLTIENGVATIKHATGTNGSTTLSIKGNVDITDPAHSPFELYIEAIALELDQRLRARTPPEYDDLWDVFRPRGQVNAEVHVVRMAAGGPVELGATVFCRDVSAMYRHFPYQLDHLTGTLILRHRTLTVDLDSFISGQPIHLSGLIENPGVDGVVKLEIQAESVPIDDTLKNAMPPHVRRVVNQFDPRGFVKAHATVVRRPLPEERGHPEGLIAIDAEIDLNERCEITWDRLPYPIRNLKGRLEVHPDRWVFKDMRGSNGRAKIVANGSVEKVPGEPLSNGDEPLKVDVHLEAEQLPFSDELKEALPPAWRKSWPIINPSGACDVIEADVHVAPNRPNQTHIVIAPRPESNARLEVTRTPQPGIDPGGTIELPMDNVHGRFVVDNGKVTMQDVSFKFRGETVRFSRGTLFLEDSGRFDLIIYQLWIKAIRFDRDLRRKMPPVMALFALKLDSQTFGASGDLQIGWSGDVKEPAWCKWTKTLVVFDDNTVKTGIPIEHIYGQLDHVSGRSDGTALDVEGILKLNSVIVLGQQVTKLESPFSVKDGVARLENVRSQFLQGEILAEDSCWISLDATPRYHAALSMRGAHLEEYARTIPGRQSYRGTINARLVLDGLGSDVRTLHGGGDAHITQGDLGELPTMLRFAKVLNGVANINLSPTERPRSPGKTAFDSADVAFTVNQGWTSFDPIKFTGNAFSLLGQGTLDPQGNLDLRLNVLLGRDRFHFGILSDLSREASTPFFMVRVQGTPSYPQFFPDPLPLFNELLKRLGRARAERPAG